MAVLKSCLKDTKIAENGFVKFGIPSIKRNRFRRMFYSKPVLNAANPGELPAAVFYAIDGLKDTTAGLLFLYRYIFDITSTVKNTNGITATESGSPLLI